MHPDGSASAAQPRTEWAEVLGPADRVTFLQEQARRRRDTWRMTALCALVVGLTGIPQSAVITPLLFGFVYLLARGFGLPPAALGGFRDAAVTAYESINFLVDNLDRLPPPELLRAAGHYVPGLAVLFIPGALASLLVWLGLSALMIRTGVGSALLALGARDPRPDDLEERQLANVVHEMAIAAGLPPPRVMLLDAPVPNAVAIGSSPETATVLVTRELLDKFDREETQGILGHLVASIGNGDLRVALRILAVFQTFGLFLTVLEAPYSPTARMALWSLIRVGTRAITRRQSDTDGGMDMVGLLLIRGLSADSTDDAGAIMEAGEQLGLNPVHRFLLKARTFILLPFLLLSLFMKLQQFLFVAVIVGPALALTWRARRYLADASAVQLTRNPDGLLRGLIRLSNDGGMVPGAQWAAHLFVVRVEVRGAHLETSLQQEMATVRGQSGETNPVGQARVNWKPAHAAVLRYGAQMSASSKGTLSDSLALMISFHPPLKKRIERLYAMGATRTAQAVEGRPRWMNPGPLLFIVPLALLCGWLMAIALGLIFMLALFADMIVIMVVLMIVFTGLGVQV